jgi:hypothetical protein
MPIFSRAIAGAARLESAAAAKIIAVERKRQRAEDRGITRPLAGFAAKGNPAWQPLIAPAAFRNRPGDRSW